LRSNIIYYAHKNNVNFIFISFLILIFFVSYSKAIIVSAQEETITIVPGSSDSSRFRFFDITEYPISTEEEIKWYNADDVIHNIVITTNDGKTIIAQSKEIKPKGFFSFAFHNEGEYLFKSSKYDWMKGKIIVTDEIDTIKKSMTNDIDLYLSWTPSSINVGEKVFFKIIFVDKKSEKNQEHIDYSFTIENPTSNRVLYKNAIIHSAWGVEPASYVFDSIGTFTGKLRIEGILFQPIEPDQTEFEITTIKE
jgi:plastocyanin